MPSTRGPDVPFWGPQLAALDAVLDDPDRTGAVVVGGPGAGKTSLVRAVLQERSCPAALTLQCSTALADVAYGALSPCLSELDDIRGPVDVLRAVQARLEALVDPGSAGRPVIIVEDCQFLDAASAFVLAQLAQNRQAVLLATSVGLRDGSGLHALVDTGLLATMTIPPLGPKQIRALCRALAGGSPTDGTVRTIAAMTGGSPRLVTAFVASAGDQGIIVRSGPDPDAPWTLVRPAPSVDERLVDVVEGMHAELTDEQQTAVTMLALAGRMPRAQLRVVAGDQAHDLAEAHVTRVGDDGMVELASVLYGEVLRATTPPGHSSVLLSRWAAAGGTALQPPPARSVVWALDNGLPVTVEDRVAAGYALLAARDLTTAWSLATGPAEPDAPGLVLLRAEVMLESARTWSGRAALVELADTATDGHLVGEALAVLATDEVRTGERSSTAQALALAWSAHLARTAAASALTGPTADWLGALDGADDPARAPQLLELSAALLADQQAPPDLRCLAHGLRGRLLAREGRLVAAAEEASLAYDEATRTPRLTALLGGQAMVRLVMSQVLLGDLVGADRVLAAQREGPVHRWHAWAGTVQALCGFVELLRGRLEPGARALRDAVLDLQQTDPEHLLPLAEALLALVTATPGEQGSSVVQRLRAGGRRGPTTWWLLALGIAGVADDIAGLPHPTDNPGGATCSPTPSWTPTRWSGATCCTSPPAADRPPTTTTTCWCSCTGPAPRSTGNARR